MDHYIPPGYVRLDRAILLIAQAVDHQLWASADPKDPFVAQFSRLGGNLDLRDLDVSTVPSLFRSYDRARERLRDEFVLGKITGTFWVSGEGHQAIEPIRWTGGEAQEWFEAGGKLVRRVDFNASFVAAHDHSVEARRHGLEPTAVPFEPVYHPSTGFESTIPIVIAVDQLEAAFSQSGHVQTDVAQPPPSVEPRTGSKRGPKPLKAADEKPLAKMQDLLKSGRAKSAHEAATIVSRTMELAGAGSVDSKIRRLVSKHNQLAI